MNLPAPDKKGVSQNGFQKSGLISVNLHFLCAVGVQKVQLLKQSIVRSTQNAGRFQ